MRKPTENQWSLAFAREASRRTRWLMVLGVTGLASGLLVDSTSGQATSNSDDAESNTIVVNPQPRRVALLIGVSSYQQNDFVDLPGAEPDIEGLARTLEQNGFAAHDVISLTNRSGARDPRRLPTASNIRKQLQRLSNELHTNDTIWIAMAGHGFQTSRADYSFCPHDADLNDPSTLIRIEEVYDVMKRTSSGFNLLLMDACREKLPSQRALADDTTAWQNIPEPPPATAAFFSCSPGELAYERVDHKSTHGVFFHAVIRGLRGEAVGADGLLTLPDLERFVKKDVQAYVEKTYASAQHPTIRNNQVGLEPLFTNLVVERQLKEVIALWDRQRREAAYALLHELLVQSPQAALVLAQHSRMLADDYEEYQDPKTLEEAIALAERAVLTMPTRAAPWISRANVRRIQGDHAAMLADCERAVMAEPHDKLAYVFRGLAHRLLDNKELMRRDAEHASTIPQFSPLAESLIAGFHFLLDDMDAGFRVLDDAILIAPDVPMLHFMKGYGLDEIGDHDNAILAYTAALRLDAEDDEILIRRAVSLARVGDRPAAIEDLKAAERLNPRREDLATVRDFVQQSSVKRQRRKPSPKSSSTNETRQVKSNKSTPDTSGSSTSQSQVIAETP